jgi:hypothetical protein
VLKIERFNTGHGRTTPPRAQLLGRRVAENDGTFFEGIKSGERGLPTKKVQTVVNDGGSCCSRQQTKRVLRKTR